MHAEKCCRQWRCALICNAAVRLGLLLNAKAADDLSAVRLHSKSSAGFTAAVCSMYSSLLHMRT